MKFFDIINLLNPWKWSLSSNDDTNQSKTTATTARPTLGEALQVADRKNYFVHYQTKGSKGPTLDFSDAQPNHTEKPPMCCGLFSLFWKSQPTATETANAPKAKQDNAFSPPCG